VHWAGNELTWVELDSQLGSKPNSSSSQTFFPSWTRLDSSSRTTLFNWKCFLALLITSKFYGLSIFIMQVVLITWLC